MPPLPLHIEAIPLVVVVTLGWRYGHTLFRRGVRLASRNAVREAALLSLTGLLFIIANVVYLPIQSSPATAWYIPVPIEYHSMSIGWLMDVCAMAFVFTTVITMMFREGYSRRWPLTVLVLVALAVAEWKVRQLAGPAQLQAPRESPTGLVLQTCGSSCAAAAGANIARHFGRKASEADMVRWMGTTEEGTSSSQVIYGLAKARLIGTKHYSPSRTIADIHPPAILTVDLIGADDGHAVAYMGMREGKAEIWDSAGGRMLLAPEALKRTWRGRAIEVRPMPGS